MLPELSFRVKEVFGGEIFLDSSSELVNVLRQRIPVFLLLELPGGLTKVKISFPVPYAVRIYEGGLGIRGGFSFTRGDRLVAQFEGSPHFPAPPRIRGRKYGMNMIPWMPDSYLPRNLQDAFRIDGEQTLNFLVFNCTSGHAGVLIRVVRRIDRNAENLEIYRFSTGNYYQFAEKWRTHRETRLMARFVPDRSTQHLTWSAEKVEAMV